MSPTATRWLRRAKKGAIGGIAVLGALIFAGVLAGFSAFGARATGARRARMEASPEFRDGSFHNPEPLKNDGWLSLKDAFHVSPDATPASPLPIASGVRKRLDTPPVSGVRATWLGHSTVLVELGSRRVLTDPVWSDRVSPIGSLGPKRNHPPPLPLADLPPIDAVVISHDHYDHLDAPTIRALGGRVGKFVVPLGVGAHLAAFGVPEARIVELDWWQRVTIAPDLEIVCAPARHASGRAIYDNDAKLWSGYALISGPRRVYFSGDTGLFPALADIGERLGPFDLTLIEIGQYGRSWPDWHLGPEQAVRAHRMLRGRVMLPIHWGTFTLAYHGWTEPIERTLTAAHGSGVTLVTPLPGESVEPSSPRAATRWWPALKWRTAAEDPIVATSVGPER